jgi:hypothetical protein
MGGDGACGPFRLPLRASAAGAGLAGWLGGLVAASGTLQLPPADHPREAASAAAARARAAEEETARTRAVSADAIASFRSQLEVASARASAAERQLSRTRGAVAGTDGAVDAATFASVEAAARDAHAALTTAHNQADWLNARVKSLEEEKRGGCERELRQRSKLEAAMASAGTSREARTTAERALREHAGAAACSVDAPAEQLAAAASPRHAGVLRPRSAAKPARAAAPAGLLGSPHAANGRRDAPADAPPTAPLPHAPPSTLDGTVAALAAELHALGVDTGYQL